MTVARPRVYGLIPAAGVARRMGAAKQLLPWGDSNIVRTVVEVVERGGVDGLVLVTNPGVSAALGPAFTAQHNIVVLDDPDAEMIDSVIAGVLALRTVYAPRDDDAFLVCPGDLPRMSAELVRRCVEEYRADCGWVVAPATQGRPRHPLVVPFSLAGELDALHGVGLQGLCTRPGVRMYTIEVADAAVVQDVDTPDDYRTLHDSAD